MSSASLARALDDCRLSGLGDGRTQLSSAVGATGLAQTIMFLRNRLSAPCAHTVTADSNTLAYGHSLVKHETLSAPQTLLRWDLGEIT